MKKSVSKIVFILFFAGTIILLNSLLSEDVNAFRSIPHLCKKSEKVIFSCQLKKNKRKIVSICGSKNLSEKKGYLKYRFGTKKKIEMDYPKKGVKPQKAFIYSSYTRPYQGPDIPTGLYSLNFKRNNYGYSLATIWIGKLKHAGVEIKYPKGNTIELDCQLPIRGDISSLFDILPSK